MPFFNENTQKRVNAATDCLMEASYQAGSTQCFSDPFEQVQAMRQARNLLREAIGVLETAFGEDQVSEGSRKHLTEEAAEALGRCDPRS